MKKIDCDALNARLDDVELIDVSPRETYREYHLPKAINIPLNERFEQRVSLRVPDRSAEIVVYAKNCVSSMAEKAARRLEEQGYTRVHCFSGGKTEWRRAGLPIEF